MQICKNIMQIVERAIEIMKEEWRCGKLWSMRGR
jgi:hypothetical protein